MIYKKKIGKMKNNIAKMKRRDEKRAESSNDLKNQRFIKDQATMSSPATTRSIWKYLQQFIRNWEFSPLSESQMVSEYSTNFSMEVAEAEIHSPNALNLKSKRKTSKLPFNFQESVALKTSTLLQTYQKAVNSPNPKPQPSKYLISFLRFPNDFHLLFSHSQPPKRVKFQFPHSSFTLKLLDFKLQRLSLPLKRLSFSHHGKLSQGKRQQKKIFFAYMLYLMNL
jgi:hypothetical protein